MNRLRITPLNYLLSSFVMAWGILPPALIHSHAGGGDTGHRHEGRPAPVEVVDHHDHSHDGQSREHGNQPRLLDDRLFGSLVSHLHWGFLGAGVSIPVPAEDHREDRLGEQDQVLIRLTNEIPILGHADNWLSAHPMSMAHAKLDCAVVETTPSRPCGVTTSIPLCDRARFERSGVLLS